MQVAIYARVSSERQARDHTIDSQVEALKERIAADGFKLEPGHSYVDDGCSGMNLQRLAQLLDSKDWRANSLKMRRQLR